MPTYAPTAGLADPADDGPPPARWQRLDEFLGEGHPLLSGREKAVLRSHYCLAGQAEEPTPEQVGRGLGISKERVRQVQIAALAKLRGARAGGAPSAGNGLRASARTPAVNRSRPVGGSRA